LISIFLVLAERLAGKSTSDMTNLVSSGTLSLNSINQLSSVFSNVDWWQCFFQRQGMLEP